MKTRVCGLFLLIALLFISVFSLSSCDQLEALISNGILNKDKLFDGKTPKDLYGSSINKYKNHKDDGVPYSLEINWSSVSEPNKIVLVNLDYNGDDLYFSIHDASGSSLESEKLIFKDKEMYYVAKDGEKYHYNSSNEQVIKYIENSTKVKKLIPAFPHNLPDSWFDSLEFTLTDDGSYEVSIDIDEKKSKDHPKYKDFYSAGVKCKLYFAENGDLNKIVLENVDVDGIKSNITINLSWGESNKIKVPDDKDDYHHNGDFNHDKGHRPGGDYRDEDKDSDKEDDNNGGNVTPEPHQHSYTSVVTAPTCTERGYTTYTCACGDSYVGDYVDAKEHNFVNGECTMCGLVNASEGLEYTLSDDGTYYIVTGVGTCNDNEVVIPEIHNSLPVKEIGNGAFYGGDFTSIVIADSITKIDSYAFDCCALNSIVIGSGLTYIGESAFFDTPNLKNIYLKDLAKWCSVVFVSSLETNPLDDGANLYLDGELVTELVIPDGVTSINSYAFQGCGSIISVVIPASVTSVSPSAFYGCDRLVELKNLSNLSFSNDGESEESFYFLNIYTETKGKKKTFETEDGFLYYEDGNVCYLLGYIGDDTELKLPENINGKNYGIYRYAFANNENVSSLTIPEGVTSIGEWAFYDCKKMTSITIHDGVTAIGRYAFASCDGLTSISIPDSVTSIGDSAFDYCPNLMVNIDGIYYVDKWVVNCACDKTSAIIMDGTVGIADRAFWGCGHTSITIPNSVIYIGDSVFWACDGLTSIIIPDSVTSIGDSAFWGCDNLTIITLGTNVTFIGNSAFGTCHKLVEVYNLSALKITKGSVDNGEVGKSALNIYTATEGKKKTFETEDGFIFYEDGDTRYLVGYKGNDTEITLPSDCNGKSYDVYSYAFYYSDKLASVIIPDSVTSICDNAFDHCNSLTNVTIGNSVTSIGYASFSWCYDLTTIIISNSVTHIADWAFWVCDSLTNVFYTGTEAEWNAISIGSVNEDLTSAPRYYYSENEPTEEGNYWHYVDGVATVWETYTVPDAAPDDEDGLAYTLSEDETYYIVTGIGNYEGTELVIPAQYKGLPVKEIADSAFYDNDTITKLVISEGITVIGISAFGDCDKLEYISIPKTVNNLGLYSFYYCHALKELYYNAANVQDYDSQEYPFCGSYPDLITIGSDVERLSVHLFLDCHAKEVRFEETGSSVTIENHAFSSGFDYIYIPARVETIRGGAFAHSGNGYTPEVKGIYVDESNQNYKSLDGNLYSKDGTTLVRYACGKSEELFVIPEDVVTIGAFALKCSYNLKSIVIGSKVVRIGEEVFNDSQTLNNVFYHGTATEWNNIYIETGYYGDSILPNAPRYYYSETEPTEEGNFWHYDENGDIEIWPPYEDIHTHSYTSVITAPTCTEQGYTTYTCSCGDSYVDDYVNATGHNYSAVVIAPTCIEQGYTTYTCTCGDSYRGDYISAKHNYVDNVCTECGDLEDLIYYDEQGLAYVFNSDKTYYIVYGIGTCTNSDIIIPYKFNGLWVCEIGERAFYDCDTIKGVSLVCIDSINSKAFYNCSNLEYIVFSDFGSSENVAEDAFDGCENLTNSYYTGNYDNFLNFTCGFDIFLIPGKISMYTQTVIPENCSNEWESGYWHYVNGLPELWPAESILSASEDLESEQLYGDYSISGIGTHVDSTIIIPTMMNYWENIIAISSNAFLNCTNITDIVIPNTITSIGDGAFSGCTNLTAVYYTGTMEEWESIIIGENNECLLNVPLYFFSIDNPKEEGNFWYSYEDVIIIWNVGEDTHSYIAKVTVPTCTEQGYTTYTCDCGDSYVDDYVDVLSHNYVDNKCTVCGYEYSSEGLLFALSDDTTYYIVAGIGSCTDETLIIPAVYKNLPVKEIGESAFIENRTITSVTIPDSVLYIGYEAFACCYNLTNVKLGKNLLTIGDYAFHLCAFASIIIPESVTTIDCGAFDECVNLTSITIPGSINTIDLDAFMFCRNLKDVTILDGVTVIDECAFYACRSLTCITIPKSITSVGVLAFSDCDSLISVFYSGTEAEWNAISIGSDNEDLTSATRYYYSETEPTEEGNFWHYVDGVPTVWDDSQNDQEIEQLFTFTLLENGTYEIAAKDVNNLPEELNIPSTYKGIAVTKIASNAFHGSNSLNTTKFLTSVTVPEGITTIGDGAFGFCHDLEIISLPSTLKTIEANAFLKCYLLDYVTIPASVTSIGDWAFANCEALTTIEIMEGVTDIGEYVFYECSSLKVIVIPKTVTTIEQNPFFACTSLTNIYYAGSENDWNNINFCSNEDDIIFSITRYYYSETEPAEEGNFWHYDDNGEIAIW